MYAPGLPGRVVVSMAAQRVCRINRFEKAGLVLLQNKRPRRGKARFCRLILACASEAQVSRDTLPGPKMAGMTAASFLELSEEARAEKIWLP